MDTPTHTTPPAFSVHFSRRFPEWLVQVNVSVACTTYQAGKVFFFGRSAQGVSVVERTFPRCMGLAVADDRFYLASLYQLWRFNDVLQPGESYQGYDRLYVPQVGWTTGDLDVHDIGIDSDGRPIFVNTLFSCLARPTESASFETVWVPPFVSRMAPEDRCHLNGLAMRDGQPAWVTAAAVTDSTEGWRTRRTSGGAVIDVGNGEVVCTGLSMPHSPRWYRDRLWLLNAGTGELGTVDLANGRFEPVTFVPGYARGLAFVDDYALIGLSKPRESTFVGLKLDQVLAERSADPWCGIAIVDLSSGDVLHSIRFEGQVEELYDVALLPGAVRPLLLGFKGDEIKRMIRPSSSDGSMTK